MSTRLRGFMAAASSETDNNTLQPLYDVLIVLFLEEYLVKYTVEINREGCIACGTCYGLDPTHFESDAEGKSKVVGGTSNGKSTGSFEDEKMTEAQNAADSCPVSVITVTNA